MRVRRNDNSHPPPPFGWGSHNPPFGLGLHNELYIREHRRGYILQSYARQHSSTCVQCIGCHKGCSIALNSAHPVCMPETWISKSTTVAVHLLQWCSMIIRSGHSSTRCALRSPRPANTGLRNGARRNPCVTRLDFIEQNCIILQQWTGEFVPVSAHCSCLR